MLRQGGRIQLIMFKVVYSLATGVYVAEAGMETYSLVEKYGFAGLAVFLTYWIVTRLTNQLEQIQASQQALTEIINRLCDRVQSHVEDHEAKSNDSGKV
jgi:hypothetical protein